MKVITRYKHVEEFKILIELLIDLFKDKSNNIFIKEIESYENIVNKLYEINILLDRGFESPNNTLFGLFNSLKNDYNDIYVLLNSKQQDEKSDRLEIRKRIYKVSWLIDQIMHEFISNRNNQVYGIEQEKVYNSKQFYEEKIASIDSERRKLKETIDKLIVENQQSQSQKEELELKKNELADAASQIEYYQKELELRKKQEDAVDEWKTKIETTFKTLKEYLLPIENEHNRLSEMFNIYRCMAAIIVFTLIVLEIISCCKIYYAADFPDFKNYIVLFIPVPVAGGLLWAFICQMNRAQRQMVILSRYKHEIQYVEGLLVSINSLSPSIDEAVKRINLALDRMIDNHLSISSKDVFTEDRFLKEEKKDGMPYDVVMNILGTFKDIAKKS